MDFLSRRSLLAAAAAVSTLKAAPSGPADEKSWREIAALYPVDRKILNFNHAGIGTSPRPVTDAYIQHIWSEEKAVPSTIFSYGPQLEPVRQGLAKLFGADTEEIAITRNATESLNAILLGLPLKAGDEVLTTTLDYWAMLDALQQREQRDGVVVRKLKVPVPCEDLSQIVRIFEQAITPKTKLILVSHPINLNGQLFPIRDLSRMAHAKGIEVVVDAAQSFALAEYKLADLECDYLGTSLHKWLQAPKGSGMLYVKRDKIGKVWPLFASGGTRPKDDIRKFELYGTWSESILAIGDAIAFHNTLGFAAKEARHRYLTQRWVDAVKGTPGIRFHTAFGKTQSCGITCVEVEGVNSAALRNALLQKRGILTMDITRRTQEFKGIRISPSLANTIEEVDKLAEALRDARKLV
jgi:selenocysteine lyase/cysteine desulfurase